MPTSLPRTCLRLALLGILPAVLGCQMVSSQPDPKNELPFGFIDAPPNGASVGRQVQMYGWALDDHGVKEVRFFVDGRYVTKCAIDTPRPDVAKANLVYRAGTDVHGWALTVTLAPELAPGPHTIIAQAVDTDGATRDIGTITVSLSQ